MSTIQNGAAFVDTQCILTLQGKSFESGGGFIAQRADNGKWEGVLYGDYKAPNYGATGTITNWHGDIKIVCHYGPVYRSNMGDNRRWVWFTWHGMTFAGCWCGIDFNQAIQVRQIKRK